MMVDAGTVAAYRRAQTHGTTLPYSDLHTAVLEFTAVLRIYAMIYQDPGMHDRGRDVFKIKGRSVSGTRSGCGNTPSFADPG